MHVEVVRKFGFGETPPLPGRQLAGLKPGVALFGLGRVTFYVDLLSWHVLVYRHPVMRDLVLSILE